MLLRLASEPLPSLSRARIYVCGITPYDTTHIGHAATFVWVDALTRVLAHVGIEPEVVRNITDVDDELLREAARRTVNQVTVNWNDLNGNRIVDCDIAGMLAAADTWSSM